MFAPRLLDPAMRQELPEIPRLPFPTGKTASQLSEARVCLSTRIFLANSCDASFGLAWQRDLMSDSYTSFREHFSHNETL
jgi:hypothetical protein